MDFVDVFLEKGFFNLEQSRAILEAGAAMGLTPVSCGRLWLWPVLAVGQLQL